MAAEHGHGAVAAQINIDATFGADVGTTKGILIWTIAEMKPQPWPIERYGEFEDGGAFIVLNTIEVGKKYDLYFWLGDQVQVGERGVCAYMVVDLDQHLGDVPVQFRECQGNESSKFLSLLSKEAGGLRVIEGGGGTSFKHVEAGSGLDFRVRLLRLKGRRSVKMEEMPLACASLNDGDVFILDMKDALYQWEGKDSNRYERVRAGEVLHKICAQRGHHQRLVRLSESESELPDFWAGIGGEGPVASAEEGGDDTMYEVAAAERLRLFRLAEDGRIFNELTEVEKPLPRLALESDGIFLLDSGSPNTGIFVWIGKDVCAKASRGTMAAIEFWLAGQQGKVQQNVPVSRLTENYENQIFKSHFQYPFDPPVVRVFGGDAAGDPSSPVAKMRNSEIDLGALNAERERRQLTVAQARDELDHGGSVKAWRMEKFQKVEVPADQLGQFFDGDSYIILHTYNDKNGKEHVMLYFWQGCESSLDEKGAVAIEVVRMDNDEYKGQATQMRVVMGKEPESFLILFKGKMIIRHGGMESGFKTTFMTRAASIKDFDSENRMFRVHGTHIFNTKVVQVRCRAKELHSDDAFVVLGLSYPSRVWKGKGATEDEEQVAMAAASLLVGAGEEVQLVNEGSEPEDFWEALGGKAEYISEPSMANAEYETRLFHVSNASGALRIDECFDFTQEDLIVEDVMILDAFDHVFCWIGEESSMEERKAGLQTARQYIESASDGRSADTPVVVVKMMSEPLLFTCHFDNWNEAFFKKFEDIGEHIHEEKEAEEKKKKEEEERKIDKSVALRRSHTSELLDKQEAEKLARLMAEHDDATPTWAKKRLSKVGDGIDADGTPKGRPSSGGFGMSPKDGISPGGFGMSPKGGVSPGGFSPPDRSPVSSPVKPSDPSPVKVTVEPGRSSVQYADFMVTHYPYEQLKGSGNKPADVDPTHKELYLSDEQFQEIFGQSKEAYRKLPAWKTKGMKQSKDLF